MNDLERMAIEHACSRLVTQFHALVDQWDHQGIAELFADDGMIDHLFLGPIRGRKAIQDYLDAKDTTSVTQHMTTNIIIDVVDDAHATGRCSWLFMGSPPDTKLPARLEGAMSAGIYEDRFVRTAKGWRFAYRRSEMRFKADHFGQYVLLAKDVKR